MHVNTARSPQIEGLFDAWNLRWRLEEDFPLADIRNEQAVQVREIVHQADAGRIDEYFNQFTSGAAKFPPITVRHGTHELVDGNTRLAMAQRAKLENYPAYVVELVSADFAMVLGAALNQMGGKRLEPNEANKAAIAMMGGDIRFSDAQIAAAVGRSASQVRQWRIELDAEHRAAALNIDDVMKQLPASVRRTLSRVKLDEPFKAITRLAAESQPAKSELNNLVKEVDAVGSEAEAMTLINDAAQLWRPTGPIRGKAVVNGKAQRMRMVLPQVLNLAPPADVYEPAFAARDLGMWRAVQDVCGKMIEHYESFGTGE
jgi:transposase-like protein